MSKTIPEWAEVLNISKDILYKRILQCKWSVDKTFSTPMIPNIPKLTKEQADKIREEYAEFKTPYKKLAKKYNVSIHPISQVLKNKYLC